MPARTRRPLSPSSRLGDLVQQIQELAAVALQTELLHREASGPLAHLAGAVAISPELLDLVCELPGIARGVEKSVEAVMDDLESLRTNAGVAQWQSSN